VVAYATPENWRSHAVMARLGLERDPARDFEEADDRAIWRCQVWVAIAPPTA
jgi:RimJ/RimL family protein N-acetyltransferase